MNKNFTVNDMKKISKKQIFILALSLFIIAAIIFFAFTRPKVYHGNGRVIDISYEENGDIILQVGSASDPTDSRAYSLCVPKRLKIEYSLKDENTIEKDDVIMFNTKKHAKKYGYSIVKDLLVMPPQIIPQK